MANKARHAFGNSENLQGAINSGAIDAYDILFLDGDTEPKVGWIDKEGKVRIVDTDTSAIEAELLNKANAKDLAQLGEEVTGKIASREVEHSYEKIKYEISHKPEGALVDYREKEIRVMCPVGTKWVKQSVGQNGNANYYYMGFKAYAPKGAVGFKEGDQGVVDDEMFDFNGDFAGTDEFDRHYSIVWLALASYDESTETWNYFGKNSTVDKYIGWTYVVEWYDANGVMMSSDCIRINLSNEECHFALKPYYGVSEMEDIETKVEEVVNEKIETKVEEVIEEKMETKIDEAVTTSNAYTDAQIEAKIAEMNSVYEVIEF